jgi:hypothetical protein
MVQDQNSRAISNTVFAPAGIVRIDMGVDIACYEN